MKVTREELVNMRERSQGNKVITETVTWEAAAREGPSRREAAGREGHLVGRQREGRAIQQEGSMLKRARSRARSRAHIPPSPLHSPPPPPSCNQARAMKRD